MWMYRADVAFPTSIIFMRIMAGMPSWNLGWDAGYFE
jgi:hypothetical protein